MEARQNMRKQAHLFTVDILIEEGSNGLALEQLLHVLNDPVIRDYRIVKGLELGSIIESAIKEHTAEQPSPAKEDIPQPGRRGGGKSSDEAKAPSTNKRASPDDGDRPNLLGLIAKFKEKGTLVRLTIVKDKGVKLNLPCRVLNFDSELNNLSVYHVDEKQVYLFRLNEIEEIIAS